MVSVITYRRQNLGGIALRARGYAGHPIDSSSVAAQYDVIFGSRAQSPVNTWADSVFALLPRVYLFIRFCNIEEILIRRYSSIVDITCEFEVVEQFLRTFDFAFFHPFEIEGVHAAFGFGHEEQVSD